MIQSPVIETTLIVPVYNEQDNIIPFINEIENHVKIPYLIFIIYDHPDDNTLLRRNEIHSINPSIRFIQNKFGTGIINAFKTGFAISQTRYVVPIMADLSDTPETINHLYDKIKEGYDLVVASRYCKGGNNIGGNRIKYCLSKFANLSLHYLTSIPTHDMTNAFIIHKKDILDMINIRSTGGFEITMEIIARTFILRKSITEVPTINRDRNAGTSKFQIMNWIGKYVYWYFYILIFSLINRINLFFLRDTYKNAQDK